VICSSAATADCRLPTAWLRPPAYHQVPASPTTLRLRRSRAMRLVLLLHRRHARVPQGRPFVSLRRVGRPAHRRQRLRIHRLKAPCTATSSAISWKSAPAATPCSCSSSTPGQRTGPAPAARPVRDGASRGLGGARGHPGRRPAPDGRVDGRARLAAHIMPYRPVPAGARARGVVPRDPGAVDRAGAPEPARARVEPAGAAAAASAAREEDLVRAACRRRDGRAPRRARRHPAHRGQALRPRDERRGRGAPRAGDRGLRQGRGPEARRGARARPTALGPDPAGPLVRAEGRAHRVALARRDARGRAHQGDGAHPGSRAVRGAGADDRVVLPIATNRSFCPEGWR